MSVSCREEHREVMDLFLQAARLFSKDVDPDVQVELPWVLFQFFSVGLLSHKQMYTVISVFFLRRENIFVLRTASENSLCKCIYTRIKLNVKYFLTNI